MNKKKIVKKMKRPNQGPSRIWSWVINEKTPFRVNESYKEIRTNLLYLQIKEPCKKIAITSSDANEGKTVNAVNIAIVMSQIGKKVLLIDADMRASVMNKYLRIKAQTGLSEFLVGIDERPNIITDQYGVDILLSGKIPPNPTELLLSDKMEQLLTYCEQKYDYVFIDTPPLNIVTDAMSLTDKIHGYVIIARAEYTDMDSLKGAVGKLSKLESNILGIVLNDVEAPAKGYENNSYNYYYQKTSERR